MRDWIVGLLKGAKERGEGLDPQEWDALQEDSGLPVPGELRDLYEAMNAAELENDVVLAPVRGEGTPGVLELSQAPADGLPARDLWVFGHQGEHPLFAVQASGLREAAARPAWLEELGEEDWVYGVHRGENDTRFYRSLEQLLARLVPPVQTEEFGDVTYARVLTAVQGALGSLEEEEDEVEVSRPSPRASKAGSKATAASRKAPAKSTSKRAGKPKLAKPAKGKVKAKVAKKKAAPRRAAVKPKAKATPSRAAPRRKTPTNKKKAQKRR